MGKKVNIQVEVSSASDTSSFPEVEAGPEVHPPYLTQLSHFPQGECCSW